MKIEINTSFNMSEYILQFLKILLYFQCSIHIKNFPMFHVSLYLFSVDLEKFLLSNYQWQINNLYEYLEFWNFRYFFIEIQTNQKLNVSDLFEFL